MVNPARAAWRAAEPGTAHGRAQRQLPCGGE
jgi:hypothetical protein